MGNLELTVVVSRTAPSVQVMSVSAERYRWRGDDTARKGTWTRAAYRREEEQMMKTDKLSEQSPAPRSQQNPLLPLQQRLA